MYQPQLVSLPDIWTINTMFWMLCGISTATFSHSSGTWHGENSEDIYTWFFKNVNRKGLMCTTIHQKTMLQKTPVGVFEKIARSPAKRPLFVAPYKSYEPKPWRHFRLGSLFFSRCDLIFKDSIDGEISPKFLSRTRIQISSDFVAF